jgi:diaminopimelate decarboxylase
MSRIQYHDNTLMVEQTRLSDVAKQFGTPCYVYSRHAIEDNWHAFDKALHGIPHRIGYAVKANSNLGVLNILARLGSCFDIVSRGELERVLAAGGDPQKIIFSGVGKQTHEIERALEVGIYCFNVESIDEIHRIHTLAQARNKIAAIALRINPDVDPQTHPYIATGLKDNKFGIDTTSLTTILTFLKALPHLRLIGIACHIGSQLTTLPPFLAAAERLLVLADQCRQAGFELSHINLGGGLGVRYHEEQPPTITDYVETLRRALRHQALELILEPGRAIVANAGVLLTRVEYLKHTPHKNFAIVDAAMNDLIRPALYNAWQDILPLKHAADRETMLYDIVGPVCESADFLGKDRRLHLQPNDLLAITAAGAYGFAMSSNYNSRPRVAEVMVDRDTVHLIRERENLTDLFAGEKIISA